MRTLADRAAGSPLFAESVTELARHGALPGEPLPSVPVPDQLLPFLTMQLDGLGDAAQETALLDGSARTTGDRFRAWPRCSAASPHTIEGHLALLVEAAIARRTGARTWLRHATVAEALLARAAHGTRAPLHERVCRHLIEQAAPAREVARHLEHCRVPDLEVGYLRRARGEAWAAWALVEARHWAELTIARDGADDAADQLVLAELEQQLGHPREALARLARLRASAEVAGAVARLRGRIAFENGRPQEAVDELTRAEAAGAVDASVSWPLTLALSQLGRFEEARDRASRQLAAAGMDEPRLRLDALANLGAVVLHQGDLETAADVLEQARTLARDIGDVMRLAHVTGDLAGARFMAGQVPEAARLLDEATGLAHRLGARRVVAMTLGNLSQIRLAGGDRDGALRAALAGAEAALAIGDVAMALDRAQVARRRRRARRRMGAGGGLVAATGRTRTTPRPDGLRCRLLAPAGGPPRRRRRLERGARCDRAGAAALAGSATTSDLELLRRRALDACAGSYRPPPEADTTRDRPAAAGRRPAHGDAGRRRRSVRRGSSRPLPPIIGAIVEEARGAVSP